MKRKRYTEEKIISILKEHEAGASVPDLARRHGVAKNTDRTNSGLAHTWYRFLLEVADDYCSLTASLAHLIALIC